MKTVPSEGNGGRVSATGGDSRPVLARHFVRGRRNRRVLSADP